MTQQRWRSDEVLAWTEGDGPGRPPRGPNRVAWLAMSATLAAIFIGVTMTDTLCPEHRAWVQALGSLALLGSVLSIIGLARGWASAPLTTSFAAVAGVAIGLIDAIHSPTRGALLAVAFGVVAVGGAWLAIRQAAFLRWDRQVRSQLAPVPEAHLLGGLAVSSKTPADESVTPPPPALPASATDASEIDDSQPADH